MQNKKNTNKMPFQQAKEENMLKKSNKIHSGGTMKKILLFFMLIGILSGLAGQISTFPWEEDFSDGVWPDGCVVNDGWLIWNGYPYYPDAENENPEGALLITPQLILSNENNNIVLEYSLSSGFYPPEYRIFFSTTGTDDNDFEEVCRGDAPWDATQNYSLNLLLSEYEGSEVYIGFQIIPGMNPNGGYRTGASLRRIAVREVQTTITSIPWESDFSVGSENMLMDGWNLGNWTAGPSGYSVISIPDEDTSLLILPKLQHPIISENHSLCLAYSLGIFYEEFSQDIRMTGYEVLISTSGTSEEDFTRIYLDSYVSYVYSMYPIPDPVYRVIDLSAYESETFYIAFRRINGRRLGLRKVLLNESHSTITTFPWIETFEGEPLDIMARGWTNI